MVKQNITLSVDSEMYLKFRTECMRNNIKFGEKLESFMSGYSNNQKMSDFLTYSEIQNPRLDTDLETMNDIILGLDPKRAAQLIYKIDEWRVRLLKK